MADIVRTQTHVERRRTRSGETTDPARTSEIRTKVTSIRGPLDASVVRDFVRALDTANAPGTALVTGHRAAEGHLTQLVTEWTERVDPPDPPAP